MRLRLSSVSVSLLLLLSLVTVLFSIGFRPDTIGNDTLGYINYYDQVTQHLLHGYIYEYLFEICIRIFAFLNCSYAYFFIGLALVNAINVILIAQNLSKYLEYQINFYRILFLLASFLFISPFFFSSQVNVLRHGISIFFLVLSFLFLLERVSLFYALIALVLAQGFHSTAIFFIFFSPLIYFKYSSVIRTTIFFFVIYISGLCRYLIYFFSESIYNKIVNYGVFSGYSSGIRYEFAAFTIGAGFIFHMLGKYFLAEKAQCQFMQLLKIYWIFTLPFFIMGFGAYSDRYLLPAWVYLSVLSAVFLGLSVRKHMLSIYWYYGMFFCSSCYFILKVQGLI